MANRPERTSPDSFLDFAKFRVNHTKPVLSDPSGLSEIASIPPGTETYRNTINGLVQSIRRQWLSVLPNTASCSPEVRGDVENDPENHSPVRLSRLRDDVCNAPNKRPTDEIHMSPDTITCTETTGYKSEGCDGGADQ